MADEEKAAAAAAAAEPEPEPEEYESDLDDAPLPVVRRRAAASDEEEEDGEEEDGGVPSPRGKPGSDADSDGQGAAEVYDEDLYEDGEEDYEEYEEVYEDFKEERRGEGAVATEAVAAEGGEGVMKGEVEAEEAGATAAAGDEEEKKDSEPYAVPTTGAFYMHDDRFQEARGRGRQRRMLNNRKLWNPKEEQAWVHDRFDEMNFHDSRNEYTRRNPRGRFRGRGGGPGGRPRGVNHGNFRGNRSRTYYDDGYKNYSYVPKESQIYHDNTKNARRVSYDNDKNKTPKPSHAHYDDVNNFEVVPKEPHAYIGSAKGHKNTPRVIRGRGSKRYQPRWRSTAEISSEQSNKSQNPENASSNANLGKQQSQISSSWPEQAFPIKQTFASNLNSASPPFYPSKPSHREFSTSQRGSMQPSVNSRPLSSPLGMEYVSSTPQHSFVMRGKVPSVGHGKLHVEAAIKDMNTPALPSSPSLTSALPVKTNQGARDSVHFPHPVVRQRSIQPAPQSVQRMPSQMFGARFSSSDKTPSTSTVLIEDTEISSPSGSNKAVSQLTVKGHHGDQGEELSSFLYGGAHVLGATGAMGLTLGDQGFHGAPALLPVMQFRGQHPGGPGVPSIGMALPGFVSQQQLGLSNSEMTWLPILTGASGALGGTYGSPYIAMNGNYYSRPSEQASSSVSPREHSASNAPSRLKSPEITEAVNDELIQRQNKPRRYSEMNFGQ